MVVDVSSSCCCLPWSRLFCSSRSPFRGVVSLLVVVLLFPFISPRRDEITKVTRKMDGDEVLAADVIHRLQDGVMTLVPCLSSRVVLPGHFGRLRYMQVGRCGECRLVVVQSSSSHPWNRFESRPMSSLLDGSGSQAVSLMAMYHGASSSPGHWSARGPCDRVG